MLEVPKTNFLGLFLSQYFSLGQNLLSTLGDAELEIPPYETMVQLIILYHLELSRSSVKITYGPSEWLEGLNVGKDLRWRPVRAIHDELRDLQRPQLLTAFAVGVRRAAQQLVPV